MKMRTGESVAPQRQAPADASEADAIAQISNEVARATVKFPTWPDDPLHAAAVLGEESGELVKAVLECMYEPHKASLDDVRKEAVQIGAMAVRFLMSIDRYEWAPGEQHSQCANVPLP